MECIYTRYGSWLLFVMFLPILMVGGALPHANAGQSALFGSSIHREPASEPWPDALAREDALFGPLKVVRIFFPEAQGVPKPWTAAELNHNRAVVVSFKLLPQRVLAGTYDDAMRNWFATAPHDRQVWWVYWHEPENDIQAGRFTAKDYRAAFAHLDQLADEAHNPMLRTTQVLMDWTLDINSGRNWRDYYPGVDVIDVQAWDQYNYVNDSTCTYQTMEAHETNRPAYQITKAEGNDYAIAEIGSQNCIAQRPAWLRNVGDWARPRAVFVTYFHSTIGGDYRLTDPASQDAWREVVNGSAFWGQPLLSAAPPTNVTNRIDTAGVRGGAAALMARSNQPTAAYLMP